jgi:hypothetical protein
MGRSLFSEKVSKCQKNAKNHDRTTILIVNHRLSDLETSTQLQNDNLEAELQNCITRPLCLNQRARKGSFYEIHIKIFHFHDYFLIEP